MFPSKIETFVCLFQGIVKKKKESELTEDFHILFF